MIPVDAFESQVLHPKPDRSGLPRSQESTPVDTLWVMYLLSRFDHLLIEHNFAEAKPDERTPRRLRCHEYLA